eukprot:c25082_g5_i2 orf=2-190(-)
MNTLSPITHYAHNPGSKHAKYMHEALLIAMKSANYSLLTKKTQPIHTPKSYGTHKISSSSSSS